MSTAVPAYPAPPNWRTALLVLVGFVVLQVAVLAAMGRIPICECGYVEFWHGRVDGQNSQHLTDWYTPSHLIHGFLFYGLTFLVMRRAPFAARLAVALGIEVGWEIVENTDWIINRYRETTVSLDYFGDSIVNSAADTLAMAVGFWLASRLPISVTIVAALVLELLVGFVIRDNLLLNVIMLLHPFEAIREWQSGA